MVKILQSLFDRVFKIKPKEFWLVQSFFFYYLCIGMFLTVSVTVGDSLLLANAAPGKVNTLYAQLYVGVAIVSILVTWLYNKLTGLISRIVLIVGMMAIFLVSIIVFSVLLSAFGSTNNEALYLLLAIWLRMCNFLLIMGFFSFLGDYFTSHDAKRLYGYIAGGLAVGSIVAGAGIGAFVQFADSKSMLWLCIGFLVISIVMSILIFTIGDSFKKEKFEPAIHGGAKTGLRSLLKQSDLQFIFFIIFLGMIAAVILDFQMKVSSSIVYPNSHDLAQFFGRFYMYVGIVEIIFQFLAVSLLLRRFGIFWCLTILPASSMIMNAFFYSTGHGIFAQHSLFIIVAANLMRIVFTESIDLPSRELLFLPLNANRRIRAQSLTAGVVMPVGQGVGGLLVIGFSILGVAIFEYSMIGIVLCAAWIVLLMLERRRYRATLAQSLKDYQLSSTDFRNLFQERKADFLIEELLKQKDRQFIGFTLDLLRGRRLLGLSAQVRKFVRDEDPLIAVKAITLLGEDGRTEHLEIVQEGLRSSAEAVREAAVLAFCRIEKERAQDRIRQWLASGDAAVQRAALVGGGSYCGEKGYQLILPTLSALASSSAPEARLAAARAIRDMPDRRNMALVEKLLNDPTISVQLAAVESCTATYPEMVPLLLRLAENPELRFSVRQALIQMPEESVPVIVRAARRPEADEITRCMLFDVLAAIGGDAARQALWFFFSGPSPLLVRVAAGAALWRMIRSARASFIEETEIDATLKHICHKVGVLNRAYREVGQSDPFTWRLLHDHARLEIENMFNLLAVGYGILQIGKVRYNFFHAQGTQQANALELLDEMLPRRLAPDILYLLDSFIEKPIGGRGLSEETARQLSGFEPWLKVVATYHLNGGVSMLPIHAQKRFTEHENALYRRMGTVDFLTKVPLFVKVPGNHLVWMARIAQQVELKAGETLFHQADVGDAMYLIVRGAIRIIVNNVEVTCLRFGEVIGEMALIDGAPRSAACVAREDSELLKINADDFNNIVKEQPDVSLALLRTLAERLRQQMDFSPQQEHDVASPPSSLDTLYGVGAHNTPAWGASPVENGAFWVDLFERVAFLHRVPLFADVEAGHLLTLAKLCDAVRLRAGEKLFGTGDQGDAIYLIRHGSVGVQVDGAEVVQLGIGECLGEMSLIDGAPRSASSFARQDSELLRIRSSDFETVVRTQPGVVSAMLGTLAERLRQQTAHTTQKAASGK